MIRTIREHWLSGVVVMFGYALLWMLVATAVHGQGAPLSDGSPSSLTFGNITGPPSLSIRMGNGALVTIRPDGTIEYGEGYTPDAAAKALWDAVGARWKLESACK